MSEVSAKLVDAGIGLPRMWWDGDGIDWPALSFINPPTVLDLTDPQTASGLAMKLDEWERTGPQAPRAWGTQWAVRMAYAIPDTDQWAEAAREMAARIQQIGRDHAVRRALGWDVKSGTLEEFRLHYSLTEIWAMGRGAEAHSFGRSVVTSWTDGRHHVVPALAGVTDPTEALRVIHEAVCA